MLIEKDLLLNSSPEIQDTQGPAMYVYFVKRKRLGLLAAFIDSVYVCVDSVSYSVSPTWIALKSAKFVRRDIPL